MGLAIMRFAQEFTPRQSGAVRYLQYRGKGRPNVQSPGQQMPEDDLYRMDSRYLQAASNSMICRLS